MGFISGLIHIKFVYVRIIKEMNYYAANTLITIFSMLIIQICLKKSNTLNKSQKELFTLFFNFIAIAAFCEWGANYLETFNNSYIFLHKILKVVELSLAPSFALILALIFKDGHKKEILLFLSIHSLIEIFSAIFGFVFYVDANNIYHHGDFYFIYVAVYLISIVYCCVSLCKNIKRYQYTGLSFFMCLVLFIIISLVIGFIDRTLKIVYPVISLVSIMCYVFTLEMIQQTDGLTELLNRRGYDNFINHVDQKCVVVFFDVDEFKMINDNYGHQTGDDDLKNIADMIKNTYGKYGKCFRYGGDEFCVILTKDIDKVEEFNHQLFTDVGKYRKIHSRFPTVSIGYAYYDPENQNIMDVVKQADDMMYSYKNIRKKDRG